MSVGATTTGKAAKGQALTIGRAGGATGTAGTLTHPGGSDEAAPVMGFACTIIWRPVLPLSVSVWLLCKKAPFTLRRG